MIDPETILIVQIGKIGDMILTTPLFREIKKLFPDSVVSVLASDSNKIIAQNNEHVNKVFVYKKNILTNLHLYFSSLKKQDLWIDTKNNYSKTSALLVKIFKPKFSMGFNFSKPVFDIDLAKYQSGNHATVVNLSPINYFTENAIKLNNIPELVIPDSYNTKNDHLINKDTNLYNIFVNLSAGDESRYLTKEKWVEVIEKIGDKNRFFVYLIGLEKEKDTIDYILEKTGKLKNVRYIKTENILDTADAIRRSNITISPDTSIIHICSVYNTPVIGIYPDIKWNVEKFHPLSEKKEIVISKNRNNIEDVKSEQIINAFNQLIKRIS